MIQKQSASALDRKEEQTDGKQEATCPHNGSTEGGRKGCQGQAGHQAGFSQRTQNASAVLERSHRRSTSGSRKKARKHRQLQPEEQDRTHQHFVNVAAAKDQQLMSRSRRDSLEESIFEHIESMEEWASGKRSHINMVSRANASAADIAVMDCQEVLIHSACAQAYAAILATVPFE